MGMPLDYIQGLNTNDVNRGNLAATIGAHVGDMDYKRGVTEHNAATLAADTAQKAAIQKLNEQKAIHENAYHDALREGNLEQARLHRLQADNYGKKFDAEIKAQDANIRQSDAAARASGASARYHLSKMAEERVYEDKDGKYMVGLFEGDKLTKPLRKATAADFKGGGSGKGSDKMSDDIWKLQGGVKGLMQTVTGEGANKFSTPNQIVNKADYRALKEMANNIGKDVVITTLPHKEINWGNDFDKIEIPMIVSPGGEVDMMDVVEELVRNHSYSRERAIEHVKLLKK